ncbi:copper resistance protein B [Immundisolibacter sp.]|uniref:copper resistance protein B n=1 Tax=Immundisolibacter sp. TaxID=1934948 RepID=UPI00260BE402|nr:copper resistance protein B [Immundisolibacter sp.]MDD3650302.1 copper resistance protein B [Immundisolibacter sp.]
MRTATCAPALAVLLGSAVAPALAADAGAGRVPADWPHVHEDDQNFGYLLVDRLEYRADDGPDHLLWDAQGWYGGDYRRLWLKTEGESPVSNSHGEAELQALYGRLVAPYWDLQAGLRYDRAYGSGRDRDRAFGVLGVQGLAPYRFDTELALFVSEDGDVSARAQFEHELLLSQRLVLQPRLEINAAAQEVKSWGVGRGIDDVQLGLRLRYELRRQFAPYVGVEWVRTLGDSADFARAKGLETSNFGLVAGLRLWF